MTKQDLLDWYTLKKQIVNCWHVSDWDKKELIRLNHLVMEACHKIHNDHMLGDL